MPGRISSARGRGSPSSGSDALCRQAAFWEPEKPARAPGSAPWSYYSMQDGRPFFLVVGHSGPLSVGFVRPAAPYLERRDTTNRVWAGVEWCRSYSGSYATCSAGPPQSGRRPAGARLSPRLNQWPMRSRPQGSEPRREPSSGSLHDHDTQEAPPRCSSGSSSSTSPRGRRPTPRTTARTRLRQCWWRGTETDPLPSSWRGCGRTRLTRPPVRSPTATP